jgi:hypothetical protein
MRRSLAAIAIGFGVVTASVIGSGWWTFVVRGDMRTAHRYPFGWEGAWNYVNPRVYGWSCLELALVVLVAALAVAAALVRRSWRWLVFAALVYGAKLALDALRDGRIG